jgi:hypothetical protein
MFTDVSEELSALIFRVENWCSMFLRSVHNIYQTTRRYIPEYRISYFPFAFY